MPWLFLLLAGLCEMVWPLGFKFTNGFSKNYALIAGTFAIMVLSLYLMSLATKGPHAVHVGTAYAVWTGLGAAGTAVLGIIIFNEPRDLLRIACIGLIISGAVGLKFLSPPTQPVSAAAQVSDNPAD